MRPSSLIPTSPPSLPPHQNSPVFVVDCVNTAWWCCSFSQLRSTESDSEVDGRGGGGASHGTAAELEQAQGGVERCRFSPGRVAEFKDLAADPGVYDKVRVTACQLLITHPHDVVGLGSCCCCCCWSHTMIAHDHNLTRGVVAGSILCCRTLARMFCFGSMCLLYFGRASRGPTVGNDETRA